MSNTTIRTGRTLLAAGCGAWETLAASMRDAWTSFAESGKPSTAEVQWSSVGKAATMRRATTGKGRRTSPRSTTARSGSLDRGLSERRE